MRTFIFIVAGIVFYGLIFLIARAASGGSATLGMALKIFLPAWLLAAAINLIIGVRSAGYTVLEELPIFLIIFGIPAIVAIAASRLIRP
jgi:hypothetical protein